MSQGITNILSIEFMLPLITIAIYIIAIIIGLDCIWRVQDRIDTFLKIVVTALVVAVTRMILGMVGLSESPQWGLVVTVTDLIIGVLFAYAMYEMYKIIRSLNLEKPKKK